MNKCFNLFIFSLILMGFLGLVSSECNETDGGLKVQIKGTSFGDYAGSSEGYYTIRGEEPNPTIIKESPYNYSIIYDYCQNELQLYEGYCENGKISIDNVVCEDYVENGVCINGACVPNPLETTKQCTEFGYSTQSGIINYCDDSRDSYDLSVCRNKTYSCTDNDGGADYYTFGYCSVISSILTGPSCGGAISGGSGGGGTIFPQDNCIDSNTLQERICNLNGTSGYINYVCPNGCLDGVCLKNYSTSYGEGGSNVCKSTSYCTVGETGCTIELCYGEDYTQKIGDHVYTFFVSETIGMRDVVISINGKTYNTKDYDYEEPALLKDLNLILKINSIIVNQDYYKKISFSFGEYNGSKNCKDSDSGRDFFTRGELFADLSDAFRYHGIDKCFNGSLVEFSCKSNTEPVAEFVKCEYGCNLGVCLKKPPEDEEVSNLEIVSQNGDKKSSTTMKLTPTQATGPIKIINEAFTCSGCVLDQSCYPFGYRKNGNYCSDKENQFLLYKTTNENCENNFECKSNLCISDQCISGNVWSRFLRWFSRVFGEE